jgi:SET domain-containing protein
MDKYIIIKKSKISGKGVFALRDFKKGEIVLKWNPKPINKLEIESLSARGKTYIVYSGKKYFIMQSPERYVNHSCEANTTVKNNSDVAVRNIRKGEEITSDYIKTQGGSNFKCKCGSKKCRKIIS